MRATRNGGALQQADIMVFMTDDAVPADERLIEHLTAAFDQGPGGSLSSWPMPGSCR